MEMIASLMGYVALITFAFIAIAICMTTIWVTIRTLHRIWSTEQTIRFLRKSENKDTYEAGKVALHFLLSKGASKHDTLADVEDMIERFRKDHRIK